MTRRRLLLLAAAAVLAAGIGAAAAWRAWTAGWTPHPGATTAEVRIPAGAGAGAVADTLRFHGLLRNRATFVLGARLTRADRRLRAGLFAVPPGLSPRELLQLLTAGPMVPVRITLPEGEDAPGLAAIVARELDVPAGRFLAAADSCARAGLIAAGLMTETAAAAYDAELEAAAADYPRGFHWCEGYLMPETYHFAEGTGAEAAAAAIVGKQISLLIELREGGGGDGPLDRLTVHQTVTLASLVEAESRLDRERPLVAAVYWNRLRSGRRLEADPTVAYLLDKRGRRLYYKDLQTESPYNTYRAAGLPPGPIGNPGRASLVAAIAPDPGCDALYFVADGEGGHVFSRTYAEHERAVREFRRRRDGGR